MNARICSVVLVMAIVQPGCRTPNARVKTSLNTRAALTGSLPEDPLRWRVITSGVDPLKSTMFTLFGNDQAIRHSRSTTSANYPGGARLALVTWQQQEDSRWFGGRIPAQVESVEFVDVASPSKVYRRYEGSPLAEASKQETVAAQRTAYLLSLRAAVMP